MGYAGPTDSVRDLFRGQEMRELTENVDGDVVDIGCVGVDELS